MAIGDDFSVSVSGDIRHTANSNTYTVLELHRWLQDLADDAQASGNDLVDITSSTPSERSTDNIITLINGYNIDDDAAKYFYDGSITQDGGDTVYSGLQVLGAVNDTDTQIMIIQDNDFYQFTPSPVDAPFWGTQSAGGYNGNAAEGILMQIMIKTRQYGADINGQRVRVQARHWGDTYDFFNVTLGQGVGVAALGTTPDAQNNSSQSTISAYTDVLNSGGTATDPTGGYQTIDLNEGSGPQPYYSQWTYGSNPAGLKAIWEYTKYLSGNGTTGTIDGLGGELFLGVTHQWNYDNETGTFQEREAVVWGTSVTYTSLAGGTFSAGDYVTIGTNGAAGRVMYDNGSTNMIVALEDNSISLIASDTITLADGVGAVTASVSGTPTNVQGGSGWLLALDDNGATGTIWIQLLTGAAPVENVAFRGLTSGATGDVSSPGVTSRTIPKIFTGSYTGTYIGAFGVGIAASKLTSSDTIQDLEGDTNTPPNNVQFTVGGLATGEDYVLVGPRSAGILQKDQFGLASPGLSAAAETEIVIDAAIPTDTPSSGEGTDSTRLRVQIDTGVYRKQEYMSYTGSTFTLPSPGTDYSGGNVAATGNNVFIGYIDRLVESPNDALSFTAIYDTNRDLIVRVRDGGGTPIKTYEAPATFGDANVTVTAIRTSDA